MNFDFEQVPVTKEEILMHFTPQQLYDFYLKEPIELNTYYSSPYRVDEDPSLSVTEMASGKLMWRDWGDVTMYKPDDIFGLVQKIYSNCNFHEALQHIAKDLGLRASNGEVAKVIQLPKVREISTGNSETRISIEPQSFTGTDFAYWRQYGISLGTLLLYDVYSVKHVWLNGRIIKTYTSGNPIYAFRFGETDYKYKIYCPLSDSKKGKWLFNGNTEIIQGFLQLPYRGSNLIITKSLKDVMCLHDLGYNAISLQSEGAKLSTNLLVELGNRFKNIKLLYDNDTPGRAAALIIMMQHGLVCKFVPESPNVKDISDYRFHYGKDETLKLLKQLI